MSYDVFPRKREKEKVREREREKERNAIIVRKPGWKWST
jgi:hypothetical protein